MIHPLEKINELLVRKRVLVGCFLIIILAFSIFGAMNLTMETDVNSSDLSSNASYVSDSYDHYFSSESIIPMVLVDSVTDTSIAERIYVLERQWDTYEGVTVVT